MYGGGRRTIGQLLAGLLVAVVALLVAAPSVAAQGVQLVPFGGQQFDSPFYVAGDPTNADRVFVVEGPGTVRTVEHGVTRAAPFLSIPEVFVDGGCNDCGVFSMAFAPDYAASGLFYVFYTRDSAVVGEHYYLRIEEYRVSSTDPGVADPASGRTVLEIPHLETSIHNGGQLQFGPDGLLYISVGDGGPQGDPSGNAQDLDSLLGKLLRIDPSGTAPGEYTIPAGNPFAGATAGADEIYAYGFRNPWRFSFDRLTGDLTVGDVGHLSWEEVSFAPNGQGLGANFGWNCFEGTLPYAGAPGACTPPLTTHLPPVLEYQNPTPGAAAVTGGYVIRDRALPSLWGRYIYADIYNVFGGELRTASLSAGGSSGDAGLGVSATNLVSFGEDACAHIYAAEVGGTVSRLEPTSGPFPCEPETPVAPSPGDGDASGPTLLVRLKQARHAARRGGLMIRVSCDEGCEVAGRGVVKIVRDPGGEPRMLRAEDAGARLEPGRLGRLTLSLSPGQRRALIRALEDGGAARASLRLTATDDAGNRSSLRRSVRQKWRSG